VIELLIILSIPVGTVTLLLFIALLVTWWDERCARRNLPDIEDHIPGEDHE